MQRVASVAFFLTAVGLSGALAQPMPISPSSHESSAQSMPVRYGASEPDLGGGFIEFLFSGGNQGRAPRYQQSPAYQQAPSAGGYPHYQNRGEPLLQPPPPPPAMYVHRGSAAEPAQPAVDPR
jgi:hypothetical protein